METCREGHSFEGQHCQQCKVEYHRKYQQTERSKDYHRKYRTEKYDTRKKVQDRARREEHRARAITQLGGKCLDCGNSDPRVLVFDHVRDEKQTNLARLFGKAWSRVEAELKKCELVCANCHLIRTNERIPKVVDTFEYGRTAWIKEPRRKRRKPITANGVTLTIQQWAIQTGIPMSTISRRLGLGWSDEDAVNKPVRRNAE